MPGRWIARLAIAILLADAAALAVAGIVTSRPWFLVAAALVALGAGGVLLLDRKQRERWEAVNQARRAVRDEVRVLAELVRRSRPPQ